MKKHFLLIALVLLIVSCSSVKKHNEQISSLHSVASLQSDVDKAYSQLKKHHPNLDLYISAEELEFKFDSLKQSIKQPLTSYEFYHKLAPVVKNVRQGHLKVFAPKKRYTKKEYRERLKKKFNFTELDLDYIEDKLLVTNIRSKDSFLIGSEIIKIEDEAVPEIVTGFKKQIASDGYNTTLYDRVIGKRFASYYFSDKYSVDSLEVTFKKEDSIFNKTFKIVDKEEKKQDSIPKDSIKKDTIVAPKLSKAERKAKRLKEKELREHHRVYGYVKSRKEYTRNIEFIGKDSTVAYMKIRGFIGGKYKDFYEEVFHKIEEAKSENLIIDLRDNGGGSLAEIAELYSYLTDEPHQFIKKSEVNSRVPFLKAFMSNTTPTGLKIFLGAISPVIIAHNYLKTSKVDGKLYYKHKQSKIAEPKKNNFKGNVYVLINGHSFSASSVLSNQLQANKRAVFVGEETGGAYNSTVAGVFKEYELPESKLQLQIGLMQLETPHKQEPEGYGVKPDYEILPTLTDKLENKDPELNWILENIENQK